MNIRDAANGGLNILAELLSNDQLPNEEMAKLLRLERLLIEIAQFGDIPTIPNRNDIDTAVASR